MMHRIISISVTLLLLAGSGVFVSATPPSNDRCIDSVALTRFEKVDGDNSAANFDYNNQGVCGARSDRRAVWYEINGVGKEVTVYLCTNNGKLMDFGVFRACNTQNCLGFPPQQREIASCDADESNEYVFMAEEGESYYIHVRSDVLMEDSGSIHTIWYTEPTDAPTVAPEGGAPSESGSNSTDPGDGSGSSRRFGSVAGINSIAISAVVSGLVFGFSSLF